MTDRDEVRDQITRALDSVLAAASTPIGRITPNQLADAVMVIVGPIVAEREKAHADLGVLRQEIEELRNTRDDVVWCVARDAPSPRCIERVKCDLALWLHAEAVWQRDQLKIEADHQWKTRQEIGRRMLDMDTELTEKVDLGRWLLAEAAWQQDEAARSARDSAAYAELDWTATEQLRVALSTERESRFRWAEEAAEVAVERAALWALCKSVMRLRLAERCKGCYEDAAALVELGRQLTDAHASVAALEHRLGSVQAAIAEYGPLMQEQKSKALLGILGNAVEGAWDHHYLGSAAARSAPTPSDLQFPPSLGATTDDVAAVRKELDEAYGTEVRDAQ